MMVEQGYDSVFAATRWHKYIWKHDYEGNLTPVNYNPCKTPARQEWDGEIIVNGMFYFFKKRLILEKSRYNCALEPA